MAKSDPGLNALLHLEYNLRALHLQIMREAGLLPPTEGFPRAATDAMTVEELERLKAAFPKVARSAFLGPELLAAAEVFARKTVNMRAERKSESFVRLAWQVVTGEYSAARGAEIARLWGARAHAHSVEAALAKQHREAEVRVADVYYALAEGTPAGRRPKSQKDPTGAKQHYGGVREPLKGRIKRAYATDFRHRSNVSAKRKESGSQCPTPDVTAAEKGSTRRRTSKKK